MRGGHATDDKDAEDSDYQAYNGRPGIMGNSLGRDGRRRRVLNEEMVAASATHAAHRTAGQVENRSGSSSTYSEAARRENHARLTDVVPRRWQTLGLGWALGLATISGLVALDFYRDAIAHKVGLPTIPMLMIASAGSLASWFTALVMLLSAVGCVLIYSLRRHKLSDYRGRYRIWLWAGAACVLLSINEVCSLHKLAAELAARLTGWTAWPVNAVWWLVPIALVCGWIAVQSIRDIWESRLARFTALLGGLALAVYLTFYLAGGTNLGLPLATASVLWLSALLLSKLMMLLAVTAYARFVILAADGQLSRRSTPPQTAADDDRASRVLTAPSYSSSVTADSATSGDLEVKGKPPRRTASATEWTDGTLPETRQKYEHGDEDGPSRNRKLSKAERKRLRKLKAQRRSAA